MKSPAEKIVLLRIVFGEKPVVPADFKENQKRV